MGCAPYHVPPNTLPRTPTVPLTYIMVIVPPGCSPGDTLRVEDPRTRELISVLVPNPCSPGARLRVDLPPMPTVVNGIKITASELERLKLRGVHLPPGAWWFDNKCGAYGRMGGPAVGYIQTRVDVGGPMSRNCSRGNTGVFLNGRHCHRLDVANWKNLVGPCFPGWYTLDWDGNNFNALTGQWLNNVRHAMRERLAPPNIPGLEDWTRELTQEMVTAATEEAVRGLMENSDYIAAFCSQYGGHGLEFFNMWRETIFNQGWAPWTLPFQPFS
mmetsp:Transcript_21550/g.67597  ORF Transcript_21550/g.67597 Transcript_21550/m.67597 type:complete len:272 (+) Transcript_21550:59-874(+)